MPPIVQERAQTSRGVLETAPRFLGNQPTGTSWDFSRIPLHPSSAPAKRLPGPIQRKLKVGAIDDPLEHEADRVADQVMRMPASDAVTISSRPQVSRKCDTCEEEEKLQKETGPQTVAGEAPASVHETLRSAGQPLDMESHAFFEPRFGRDLSQVRIHADPRAAESAHSVYARAYTVGHHVVFGRDQYAPHTADGRHLLAHELTHTLQQQGGVPSLRRDPPKSPPPTRPDLETRLKIIEETGPATQARLDQIIHTDGIECSCDAEDEQAAVAELGTIEGAGEETEPVGVQAMMDRRLTSETLQREATSEPAPKSSIPKGCGGARACFSISQKRAWLLNKGAVEAEVGALGGRKTKPTPKGKFHVIAKDPNHVSKSYPKPRGGAKMPNYVRIGRAFGFHAGSLSLESHGCIHLGAADAKKFFDALNIGDEVYVVP